VEPFVLWEHPGPVSGPQPWHGSPLLSHCRMPTRPQPAGSQPGTLLRFGSRGTATHQAQPELLSLGKLSLRAADVTNASKRTTSDTVALQL